MPKIYVDYNFETSEIEYFTEGQYRPYDEVNAVEVEQHLIDRLITAREELKEAELFLWAIYTEQKQKEKAKLLEEQNILWAKRSKQDHLQKESERNKKAIFEKLYVIQGLEMDGFTSKLKSFPEFAKIFPTSDIQMYMDYSEFHRKKKESEAFRNTPEAIAERDRRKQENIAKNKK